MLLCSSRFFEEKNSIILMRLVLEIQSQIDLFYSDHTIIQMNEFAIKEQLPSYILIF
jgi:hypothetical protein